MSASLQHLSGYQVHEYKIILTPHEELIRQAMEVRKLFNEKFKIEAPMTQLPEITLVTFKQIQAAESRITNRLKIIGMASHPIKIELRDFGSYPSHTIFFQVTSKGPVGDLVKKIRHAAQRLMKLDADNVPHFMNDTNITLARKLKPWQYENGWLECSNKHFTGRFMANRMLLLKRKDGEFKYKPVESFEFLNLPVETKQGELF
ncbi:MAG: hypothetical protein ABJA37_13875 [Ferruginibacter sp.]